MKAKIKAFFEKHAWLRKSVTIPVKLVLLFAGALFISVVTLSIAKRVEPKVNGLLSAEKMVEPLDVTTAAIALERLKAHITTTCTKPAPAPVVKYKTVVKPAKKDDVR